MAVTSSESGLSTAYNVHVHFVGWKGPLPPEIASSSSSATTTSPANSSSSTTHNITSSNIYHHLKLEEQEETIINAIHQTTNTALDNHGKSHPLRVPYHHRLVQPQEYLFAHLVYRCPLLEQAHVAMSASCVAMQKHEEERCVEVLSSKEGRQSSTPYGPVIPRISSVSRSSASSSRVHDEIIREEAEKQSNEEEEEDEESLEMEHECALRTVLDYMLENSAQSDLQLVNSEGDHTDKNREDGADGQRRKGKGYGCCASAGRKTLEKIAKFHKMETIELFYPFVQLPFALVEKQLREEYAREQANRARRFYAQLVPPFTSGLSTSPSSFIKRNEMVYFDIIIAMDRASFEYIVQYYSHPAAQLFHAGTEGRHCNTACYVPNKDQATPPATVPPTATFPPLHCSNLSSLVGEKRGRDREAIQSKMNRSRTLKWNLSGDNNADEGSSILPSYSPSFFSRKPILVVYPSTSDSRFAESSSSSKSGTSSIINHRVCEGAASGLISRGVTRGNPPSFSHFSSEEFSPPPLSEKTMDHCCHAVQHLLEMLLVKSRIREEENNVPICTPDDGVNERDPNMLASTGSTVAATINTSDDFLAEKEGGVPPQNSDQDEGKAVIKMKPTEKEKEFFFNTNWRDDIERVLAFLSPILSVDFMVAMV